MSLIIAVKSCQKDLEAGAHNVIRSTWGHKAKAAGIETRFFVGASNTAKHEPDEIHLPCDDSYKGLPYKTREICRWFIGKKIDHILLCDIDTYVIVKYVLTSGYQKWDYFGTLQWTPTEIKRYEHLDPDGVPEVQDHCYSYASGGRGYFLSRKAANEISVATPSSWCEDLWVGQVLMPLCLENKMKYESTRNPGYTGNQFAVHYEGRWSGNPPYDPKSGWMDEKYKVYG